MFRNTVLMIVFSFAVGLVGCRACWGPYDHCQPTFVPEAGDQCMGELYRNGSVLGGMDRRGDCYGGCSSCAGEAADSGYSEGIDPNYGFIPEDGTEYADPSAEPLPAPEDDGTAVPPASEGAPANNKTSIQDYLPEQSRTPGI